MENASKALIIAGAILISIIIIGLGVYLVNMAQSAGKKVNLDSQAAQAQNGQFTAYFGRKQSASDVKALMSLITTNNITGNTGDETKTIYTVYDGDGSGSSKITNTVTSPSQISRYVKPGKTYDVDVIDDTAGDDNAVTGTPTSGSYYKSGYIKIIKVKQN